MNAYCSSHQTGSGPEVGFGRDPTRRYLDCASAPAIVNPVDLHALEAALQLAGDVVAITSLPGGSASDGDRPPWCLLFLAGSAHAERALQFGETRTTIKPDLYIACGVSGAFQHVIGMWAAKTVVAINHDPDAAIFRFTHAGIVADVLPG